MSNLPKPPDPTPPLAQLRERFHHSARRGFLAGSPYACLLADDFADTLLCSRILAAVSGQFLDTEIRAMWDHVSRQYPNASASLRTVLAWDQACELPGALAALALRHQSGRSLCRQNDANLRLKAARRRR